MKKIILLTFIFLLNSQISFALINAVSITDHTPVVQINFKNNSHVCSGVFIDKNTILTAAHCVTSIKTWKGFTLEIESILDKDGSEILVKILKLIPHPDFSYHWYGTKHDLALIKTSDFKYDGVFPELELSTSSPKQEGRLYACGRTNFQNKERKCQQGKIKYNIFFNQLISWGVTQTTQSVGEDVSIAPNDSGGILINQTSGKIIGIIWGTWSPLLKDISFIKNPNFMTPITEEHLYFIRKNQGT